MIFISFLPYEGQFNTIRTSQILHRVDSTTTKPLLTHQQKPHQHASKGCIYYTKTVSSVLRKWLQFLVHLNDVAFKVGSVSRSFWKSWKIHLIKKIPFQRKGIKQILELLGHRGLSGIYHSRSHQAFTPGRWNFEEKVMAPRVHHKGTHLLYSDRINGQ